MLKRYLQVVLLDKARIAVQVVCNELYQHKYYLSKEEQLNSVDVDQVSMNISCIELIAEHARSETNSKAPKINNDYEIYKYVLPLAKIIQKYKNLQATQEETNASIKLFLKSSDEKVTFHFDTTSWGNIDDEWPAIILNFSSNVRFNLQPLFFAYENSANITDLIIETLEYVAVAGREVLSQNLTAKTLWENIDNLMTDSVTKNLEVENYVAEKLGSHHVPYHLLCKAHVIEKFDKTNLKVLSNIKIQMQLCERFKCLNASLKPFFRGKKAISWYKSNAKSITHEKSGDIVTLAEEFHSMLEQEWLTKHISLYKERP